MPYFLRIHQKFDAAHSIPGYPGKCARLHGHTYEVECVLQFATLDGLGMGCDFSIIKSALKKVIDRLDHENLNEILAPDRTTVERLSEFFFRELEALGFPPYEVTVQEGTGGSCTYRSG